MSDNPLVTIAIPTYNRANGYLSQALASAVEQTYSNIEILVSDNCSDDHTEEVVTGVGDSRIRYNKHPENIGANNNFNYCVEQARGKYFLLLSDDDLIDPDFVDQCMQQAQSHPDVGIIRTGTRVIDGEGKTIVSYINQSAGMSPVDQVHAWFEGQTSFYLCSTLFHTAYLQQIGGFNSPHNLFQDVVAELILLARYGSHDLADVKASFRHHAGEMTHAAKVENWCEDSRYLVKSLLEEMPDQAEALTEPANRFMTKINYKRAKGIDSKLRRLSTYFKVYRYFGNTYSPFRYLFDVLSKRVSKKLN